ncbi:DNA translocase FtsK [Staphylococcus simiae]|uniref:Putative DNA translocase (FtsK/SpoIIIE family protein) n=2 Tax=Bacteria TaxID=2 RepID=G5JJ97_9STAP|nr:DNA translocase FtsK [Staphylococcus simiae]EHJ07731.1 putative DNA translocase (FtsK/SpoIIIE family protein) [Staphylococcus simiae CCM 7213 = CCUG 51256]PNZ13277.1 DNA translocase FtsK [Staphylococcus simiae]SNV69678.1 DNA translocase FtsK [Staphylococcus simiae]
MPQTKRKTTSKKKGTTKRRTNSRKKQNDNPIRYVIAILVVILVILGIFQLGIIGRVIDSFFNYLFGFSRYLTYILVLLSTGYLTYSKRIPKSRRTIGSIVLQFALLFLCQLIYYFNSGIKSEREPVLTYVYKSYEQTMFPNFGGGVLGYYLFILSEPLISIVGVVLITLLLLISSMILLTNHRHRDVSKIVLENIKSWLSTMKIKMQARSEQRAKKKEEKSQLKSQKAEEQRVNEVTVKDVSDLPEVSEVSNDRPIPIFGHDDSEEQPQQSSRKKRLYNQDNNKSSDTAEGRLSDKNNTQQSLENDGNSEVEGSIVEAGEVTNVEYVIPPLTLLNQPAKQQATSKSEVQRKGQILENTMKDFGVNAKVTQIKIGPAVTQYEIQPAQGVKVSKIVNLHNDIALALAAKDVRIEAPIPGRSAVGIEVPNEKISLVSLKEVLDEKFPSNNKLEVGLGRDISGDPITVQLDEMPHLLVAGSTGSGKSVCINGIITSILLNAKPHEVKLMLIDPKMVELNVYNGIPHLLIPVVTNPHKAAQALEKIVAEMERRYDLFQHSSTRNIKGYNAFIRKQNQELDEKQAELPYIVVIVDELADLMMVAGKEVENAIQRITQMARAAGIHLIVATQRPSVDVITGIIKNNIPSRIAFAVSSQTDSRTIIGTGGAEKLLGKGDMLYVGNGDSTQTRIQGAFLSDQEVQDVVNYVVQQQQANYVKEMEPDAPVDKSEMKSEDALYDDAYLFVIEQQKASTSLLQRQFRIGYNRASRLMDDLERNQVIGPQKGSKPRQVLIDLNNDEV